MTMLDTPTMRPLDRRAGLPVAIIGAGPIGLAAAAQLLERGVEVVVFEQGESAGSAIRQWGHTRLFSGWEYLVDAASVRLLQNDGWTLPAGTPNGRELVELYLEPLAAALGNRVHYGTRVTAVTRQGMDRTRSAGRAEAPFLLRANGTDVLARAVIDASGTYGTANGLVAGLDVESPHISHALPDVLGSDRARFEGKHTLVVGAGHSAANTLLGLAALEGTTISWAIRNAAPVRVFTGDDELAGRASLGARVQQLVDNGRITLIDSLEIDAVTDGPLVEGRREGQPFSIRPDVIVAATGFRPDLAMLREIRLSLDEVVEAPVRLAPLIDPNLHSCGTVEPHGVAELAQPEPDFYIAGMKSYGRAPTFLLATGYEQVRSIADELAGNHDAARLVQLELPATGVCSTDLGSCCS
jgi:thioredoxin reductase